MDQTGINTLTKYIVSEIMKRIAVKYILMTVGIQGYLVTSFVTWIVKAGLIEGGMVLIAIDKHEDRLKYDDARTNYDQAVETGKSDEEIKKLEQELIDSMRNHVKFG
jgi:hypothetical protein